MLGQKIFQVHPDDFLHDQSRLDALPQIRAKGRTLSSLKVVTENQVMSSKHPRVSSTAFPQSRHHSSKRCSSRTQTAPHFPGQRLHSKSFPHLCYVPSSQRSFSARLALQIPVTRSGYPILRSGVPLCQNQSFFQLVDVHGTITPNSHSFFVPCRFHRSPRLKR